jgi:uncharacterized protein (DUF849 family)
MIARPPLMVAPNGARRTKADHPHLPITPQELADTARRCFAAGGDSLHLHVRDKEQRHSLDAGRYREAIAAIAEAVPGLAIQITTESAGIFSVAHQLACLEELRPAAASISVREMAREPDLAARVYALCREVGTRVQHILYTPDCLPQLEAWDQQGLLGPLQREVIFVLGGYSPARSGQPQELSSLLSAIACRAPTHDDQPSDDHPPAWRWSWSVCAFGPQEIDCLLAAWAMGGGARIGFENNIHDGDGRLLPDNAASLRALIARASAKGLWPASPSPSIKDTQ